MLGAILDSNSTVPLTVSGTTDEHIIERGQDTRTKVTHDSAVYDRKLNAETVVC